MSRWGNLFDDLESQLEQELAVEEVDLRAEEERLRLGRLSLRQRLVALVEDAPEVPLTLVLPRRRIAVRVASIGRDWLSGDEVGEGRRATQCLVPLGAVRGVALERSRVPASVGAEEEGGLSARLGFAFVLRDLARRRRAVTLDLGEESVAGTVDRVGRDHLDVAVHELDVPRRERHVREVRLVPFAQISVVRL